MRSILLVVLAVTTVLLLLTPEVGAFQRGGSVNGEWSIDDGPAEELVGPIGRGDTYKITNDGPGEVNVSTCVPDGSGGYDMIEGATLMEGDSTNLTGPEGTIIKGQTDHGHGAEGSYQGPL